MKPAAFVENNPIATLLVLAALFAAAVLLRQLTPAAFIGMLFGGVIMWCYGRNPTKPAAPGETG
jgi:hypothetical protein